MQTTITRWGNDLGIRIPRELADAAGLSEGAPVVLGSEGGCITLQAMGTPSLGDLVSRITPDNRHGKQWRDGPIGREVW